MRPLRLLMVIALLAGCTDLSASAPSPPELSPPTAEFRDAPTEVRIAGATYRLDARVWRNVQPHAGGGGVPRCANLCAKALLVRIEGDPGADVTIDGLWALRGDGLAAFDGIDVTTSADGVEVAGERGPRSDAGTRLAVIARVTTETDGTARLVRSPEVEVGPDE